MSSNLPLATIMAIAKLHAICHLLFRKTHAICQHLKRVEKKTPKKSEMKAANFICCRSVRILDTEFFRGFFISKLELPRGELPRESKKNEGNRQKKKKKRLNFRKTKQRKMNIMAIIMAM